ncbi:unnamed protein product [Diamesa serratosioi]
MTIPKEVKQSENECLENYEDNSCVATKDPFIMINEELHDLVLQHLDAEASEVCLSWCDHICYSKDCMKNFVVSLNSHFNQIGAEQQAKVVEIMKNSKRKYQNLQIMNCDVEATEKCLQLMKHYETNWDCLQYISIGDMQASIVNLLFREMRVLQTINLGNISNLLELNLTENTSIITIKLPYLDDEESLQKLLLASPNCEELYCKVINRQLLDFVILNMKHLKVLSSKNPIDEELIDFYERVTDANVNKNIKMFVTEYW